MKKEELPEIIYFEEKAGTNGIHCLDYQNESPISYIRSDLVKNNIVKSNVIWRSELLKGFLKKHYETHDNWDSIEDVHVDEYLKTL